MNERMKRFAVVSLICLFFVSFASLNVMAADDSKNTEPLFSELKYDDKKKVLSGKTRPNSNVFVDNIAGSVVASETGEFEIPIPKGTKKSLVSMLDAEGDNSTNIRYDFEKNTIESEEKTNESTKETIEDKSVAKTSSTQQDAKKDSPVESAGSQSKESANASEESTKKSVDTENDANVENDIIEESYESMPEPKRSLVWLRTLLILVLIGAGCVGVYIWYKKKLEKEEAKKEKKRKHKKKKKNKTSRVKSHDVEEDEFEQFMSHSTSSEYDRPKQSKDELGLLIDKDMKKTGTKSRTSKKTAHRSKGKSHKKKTSHRKK